MYRNYEGHVKFDTPMEHGPVPRWQRKMERGDVNGSSHTNLSPSKSFNASDISMSSPKGKKTPRKTPLKSPGRPTKTPDHGDRFIPKRCAMNFEEGHHKLIHESGKSKEELSTNEVILRENLANRGPFEKQDEKILRFKSGVPTNHAAQADYNRVIYSASLSASNKKKTSRHIPQAPERVLDAPDFIDDYYLNLLHWGNSHLAVALGQSVYLWNALTGDISQLCQMEASDSYVSSVRWLLEGNSAYIAVGTNDGSVQLWDARSLKKLRTMTGHSARVGSLSWNSHILSSGSRSGAVHQHDVRVPDHLTTQYELHCQEVCGLDWSSDGHLLASGGNDNLLLVWDARVSTASAPMHQFSHHTAAVKAVSWCPWQSNLLVSGGGTSDRCIKLWNVTSGNCLSSTDTNSQVCGILWSDVHKELISGHGYAHNQLTIWKYPSMKQVTELRGHTSRILALTMSPDKACVMSASADETLRLWRLFPTDKISAKTKKRDLTSSFTVNSLR